MSREQQLADLARDQQELIDEQTKIIADLSKMVEDYKVRVWMLLSALNEEKTH